MKSIRQLLFHSAFLLTVFGTGIMSLQSQTIHLKDDTETRFQMVKAEVTFLEVRNTIAELQFYTVKTVAGPFDLLRAEGHGFSNLPGDPQLPVMKQLIEIPVGAVCEVGHPEGSFTEYDLAELGIRNPLFPAQPPVSKEYENPGDIPFIYNAATYLKDEFLGQETARVEILGTMRSVRLARLEIAPVQYNPVTGKIRVYQDIRVTIRFEGADIPASQKQKAGYFSPFFEGIFNQVVNYQSGIQDELIMDEPATLVIVSDPSFQQALQPFIQWKTKKGFRVIEGYTNDPAVGTTTASIKNYLKGLYQNPPSGYLPPAFVLFAGDVAQIPTFNGTSGSHVTDLYYCEYTNDIYPEVLYGRFSATNLTQLQPQIDKTLEYEQYTMPDPAFLDEVVMVAGADANYGQLYGNGQINYGTNYYFNMAHGMFSHTYLQPEPSGGNYSQNIRQNVSDGVGYANYTAHCSSGGWADPSFQISHIAALTNAHKYPLMVGNCCLSVKFEGTCFGEEIVRAANKGALGYIGGSNNTYWDEDYWWGVGFKTVTVNPSYEPAKLGAYDRTFHDHAEPLPEWYVTQGQMIPAGNLAVTQSGSAKETYYWEIYHLMGDPSLMAYFSQPDPTTANYAALMPLGSTSFTVNTQPYAYVAISKDNILYGAAVADASGEAVVALTPLSVPGQAFVVVTRQNGQPFTGTVVVASPAGPYVLLDEWQINDQAGNNNGLPDYNESILLNVTLENVGSQTANNVTAMLSTIDTFVQITDDTQTWPPIAPQATSTQNGAFAVQIGNNVPDGHLVMFLLEISDGTETWTSTFSFTVNAPQLQAGFMIIDDNSGGNGNGLLDPGEIAGIQIAVSNPGHSASQAGTATLTSGSPWITVNSGNTALPVIVAGGSANAGFNITVSTAAPVGSVAGFDFQAVAGAYTVNKTYAESIGLVIEDFESGGFSSFPWIMSGNANWTVTLTGPYEGIYCAKSGTISHSQSTALSLSVKVASDDSISFYRKVSSEANYDYLEFWIDGVMKEKWAGSVDWGRKAYFISAGLHTLKWNYMKDGSLSNGSDCAWIDYIVFPPLEAMVPDISVTPAILGFGDVIVGQSLTKQLTVTNTGSMNLTGIITTPADFTVAGSVSLKEEGKTGKNTLDFVILPGESEIYDITFAPQGYQCYAENIEIASNDPDTPLAYCGVTGCGRHGPSGNISPASITRTLAPGAFANDVLHVGNTGDMILDFTAQVIYNPGMKSQATCAPSQVPYWTGTTNGTTKTQNSLVKGWNTEDGWFKFDVSSIPAGSVINSIELHAYVNQTYYPYWSATSLPMDPVIASAADIRTWIQGHSSQSAAYLYRNESSGFQTGWINWTLGGQANVDLAASLAQGWFAVGMDSRDNSNTYYIVFDGWNQTNEPYLQVDYTYNPPYQWLKLNGGDTFEGSTNPGSVTDIALTLDAGSLAPGAYLADIKLTGNDPVNGVVMIPVTLYVSNSYQVSLKAYLQGPFANGQMNTNLITLPDFPLTQPYQAAPWNYIGTESVAAVPNNQVVDWVLVELRDATDAGSATGVTVIARQAGFLLRDGTITRTDGSQPLLFTETITNQLFAVVIHRNHLSVMSANPLEQVSGQYNYDYTFNAGQVYGGSLAHVQLPGGLWGLAGGDGKPDGQISTSDKIEVWLVQTGSSGYKSGDFNCDGNVNNTDKISIWAPNGGLGCQVP